MFTYLQYRILEGIRPVSPDCPERNAYEEKAKLRILSGDDGFGTVSGEAAPDFWCGEGVEAPELALNGAARVIGLDVVEEVLEIARRRAMAAGAEGICVFATSSGTGSNFILWVDAVEHFGDPAEISRLMDLLLARGGDVRTSFGSTWYHPLGGHLFSVFPCAHLLFSESALIRWRVVFKTDGATRFSEEAGGFNQITIQKFVEFIIASRFRFESLELAPKREPRLAEQVDPRGHYFYRSLSPSQKSMTGPIPTAVQIKTGGVR
jgi:hypothetical protein